MNKAAIVTIAVALACSRPVAATDFGPGVFAKPAQMSTFAGLVGDWQCDGSFPRTGAKLSSTMRFETDLGGSAILKHHDDVPPGSYHAVEAWVYDPGVRRFAASIVDDFGGVRDFTSSGFANGVLVWTSAPAVNPLQQFVYTHVDETTMRVDWQIARDGSTYVIGDTLTCKKYEPGPRASVAP